MLCPVCKKAEGTLEVIKYIDDKPVRGAVCHDCYAKASSLDTRGFYYLFSVLPKKACPVCGRTYGQFASTLILGCPHCYKFFEAELSPLIKRLQSK